MNVIANYEVIGGANKSEAIQKKITFDAVTLKKKL
jgi:hypothetical protein